MIQDWAPRGQEHHRLEPHPARDRVDDVEHPADQPTGGSWPKATSIRFATSSTSIRTPCYISADETRAAGPRVPRPRTTLLSLQVRGRRGGRARPASPTRSTRGSPTLGGLRRVRRDPTRSRRLTTICRPSSSTLVKMHEPSVHGHAGTRPGVLTSRDPDLRSVARPDAVVAPVGLPGAAARRPGACSPCILRSVDSLARVRPAGQRRADRADRHCSA